MTKEVGWEELERLIGPVLAPYGGHGAPGIGIAISHAGNPVFRKAFGFANTEHAVPFTLETPVAVASITKSLVAGATIDLAAQGALSLDERIGANLADYPACAGVVTVRDLLMNSSGLWHDERTSGLMAGAGYLTEDDLRKIVIRQSRPVFEPASRFSYSDANWRTLARFLAVKTGLNFAEIMSRFVFEPYGMLGARLSSSYQSNARGEASIYLGRRDAGLPLAKRRVPFEVGADGAVIMSTLELSNWLRSVCFPDVDGISRFEVMCGPYSYKNGRPARYGLGVRLYMFEKAGLAAWGHGGANGSFYCYVPELDLEYVAVTNWRHPDHPHHQLMQADEIVSAFMTIGPITKTARTTQRVLCLSEEKSLPLPAKNLLLTGSYFLPDTGVVLSFMNRGAETLASIAGTVIRLRATGPTSVGGWAFDDAGLSVTWDGQELLVTFGGPEQRARRIVDLPVRTDTFGQYFCETLGTVYSIEGTPEGARLTIGPGLSQAQRSGLQYFSDDVATAFSGEITLAFQGVDGGVSGFTLSADAIGSVTFRRIVTDNV